ncbi:MAG TPA: DUF1918 domain-containing protein [Actinomycetota bacterium]|nr:DUF1918 domain-containing protein [Actinomycetota bacterium]
MEAKSGDRVSVDAKKVGQPRRAGVIRSVSKGISGARYQVRWDDGQESVLAPGAGNLVIEGRGGNGKGAGKRRSAAKPAKKKTAKRKR